jgi:hypothetical protein
MLAGSGCICFWTCVGSGDLSVVSTNQREVITQMTQPTRSPLVETSSAPSLAADLEFQKYGLFLAGFHIGAGARRFADYARAMLADLGEGIRPFLKSFYNGVRYYPGIDSTGMSTPEEVDAEFASLAGRMPQSSLGQQVCRFIRDLLKGETRPVPTLLAIQQHAGAHAKS